MRSRSLASRRVCFLGVVGGGVWIFSPVDLLDEIRIKTPFKCKFRALIRYLSSNCEDEEFFRLLHCRLVLSAYSSPHPDSSCPA